MEKIVRGAFLGAFTPVLIALATTLAWSLMQPDASVAFAFLAAGFAAAMAVAISLASTLIFGIPTYLIFEWLGIRSAKAYVIWGVVFSILSGVLFVYPTGPQNAAQRSASVLVLLVALFSGPASAFVFWRSARPDLRALERG